MSGRLCRKEEIEMAVEGVIYCCELCGQEVKVVKKGTGILRCCGEVMKKKDMVQG